MKIFLFVYFLVVPSLTSFAQAEEESYIQAYPIIGWDLLREEIEIAENYPRMPSVEGIMGSVPVLITIDSSGTLMDVVLYYNASLTDPDTTTYHIFVSKIKQILEPIEWYPSYKNGKPITDNIYKTFNFLLLGDNESEFNIIAPKVYVK